MALGLNGLVAGEKVPGLANRFVKYSKCLYSFVEHSYDYNFWDVDAVFCFRSRRTIRSSLCGEGPTAYTYTHENNKIELSGNYEASSQHMQVRRIFGIINKSKIHKSLESNRDFENSIWILCAPTSKIKNFPFEKSHQQNHKKLIIYVLEIKCIDASLTHPLINISWMVWSVDPDPGKQTESEYFFTWSTRATWSTMQNALIRFWPQ